MALNVRGEVYPARRGLLLRKQWRGRILSRRNGQIILVTPEGYNNQSECVEALRDPNPELEVDILDSAGFTVGFA